MHNIEQTVERLVSKKLLQIDELNLMAIVIEKRIAKLTEQSDIAKNKVLLQSIKDNIIKAKDEIKEFKSVI